MERKSSSNLINTNITFEESSDMRFRVVYNKLGDSSYLKLRILNNAGMTEVVLNSEEIFKEFVDFCKIVSDSYSEYLPKKDKL